jgi:hypothetical protein
LKVELNFNFPDRVVRDDSPYPRESSHSTRIPISKGLEWRHVTPPTWHR